jgi:hypothetical protein
MTPDLHFFGKQIIMLCHPHVKALPHKTSALTLLNLSILITPKSTKDKALPQMSDRTSTVLPNRFQSRQFPATVLT